MPTRVRNTLITGAIDGEISSLYHALMLHTEGEVSEDILLDPNKLVQGLSKNLGDYILILGFYAEAYQQEAIEERDEFIGIGEKIVGLAEYTSYVVKCIDFIAKHKIADKKKRFVNGKYNPEILQGFGLCDETEDMEPYRTAMNILVKREVLDLYSGKTLDEIAETYKIDRNILHCLDSLCIFDDMEKVNGNLLYKVVGSGSTLKCTKSEFTGLHALETRAKQNLYNKIAAKGVNCITNLIQRYEANGRN